MEAGVHLRRAGLAVILLAQHACYRLLHECVVAIVCLDGTRGQREIFILDYLYLSRFPAELAAVFRG